jgi:hypothetical protein
VRKFAAADDDFAARSATTNYHASGCIAAHKAADHDAPDDDIALEPVVTAVQFASCVHIAADHRLAYSANTANQHVAAAHRRFASNIYIADDASRAVRSLGRG